VLLTDSRRPQGAAEAYRKAIESLEKLATDPDGLARNHHNLGQLLRNAGRSADAENSYRRAIAIWAKLANEHPQQRAYRQHLAYAHWDLAAVVTAQKRLPQAEEIYRQALNHWQKLVDHWPDDPWTRNELASSHGLLADLLKTTQRPQEAEKAYGQALALQQQVVTAAPTNAGYRLRVAEWHDRLGELFEGLGRLVQAEQQRRQALAIVEKLASEFATVPDYRWHRGIRYDHLGELLKQAKRPKEAEKALGDAITVWTKLVADYHVEDHRWHLACSHDALGHLCREGGRLEEAAKAYRKAQVEWVKLVEEFNHPDRRAHMTWNHGWLFEVLASLARQVDRDSKRPQADRAAAAQALRAEATQLCRDGLKRGLDTPQSLNDTAWRLATDPDPNNRDPAWAVELAKLAAQGAPGQGYIVNTLGTAYYRAGHWKEAIETLKKAEELYQGRFFSSGAFFIAMAHWQLGDKEVARKWYLAGVAWMEKYAANNDEQRRFRAEAAALIGMPEWAPAAGQQKPQDEPHLYTLILDVYPEAAWAYFRRGLAYAQAGEQQKAQADFRHAVDRYTHALEANRSWVLYVNRGNAHAELAQWDRASADYAQAAQDQAADQVTWYRHALLRLHLADREGYRKACTTILDRFSKQENPVTTDLALWACVLGPDSLTDYPRLVQWAEKLLAAQPKNVAYLNWVGAALYRAGRFEEALRRLNEADALYKPADEQQSALAFNRLFLAMAHHRLGHVEEAKKWHAKAVRGIEQELQKTTKEPAAARPLPWNRRLTLQLLRREAEELLRKEPGVIGCGWFEGFDDKAK
jgi:tetratricopeptide (TPR) repeat protein